MRKFKVGDKVRIGAVSEFPEDYQQEYWIKDNTYKEGVITFVDPEHSAEELIYLAWVGVGEERIPLWFPEQGLTKIEDKETKEMVEFKVGDTVRVSKTLDYQKYSIDDDIRGKIGKVTSTSFWGTHAQVWFEDLEDCWYVRNQYLTKIGDEETKEMVEFKVGDTVRAKEDIVYKEGSKIPAGTVGGKVRPNIGEGALCTLFGKASVFRFGKIRVIALNDEVEKVEATETPKTEEASSELQEYTIYFINDKMPLRFRGEYVSADAEFEYYETEDGREIEVRSDTIQIKTSRKVR